ncbi:MAG: nicotinate-nucleotide adenylyltransferase [Lachnospiraceae bacterium]|nr:nicotinate-nucleotide adenylyltransferase [Lachnospiraceae bacterium]
MRVGIVGGTFDPVHLAHLEMGRAAKRQKDLDQIWFMPSKIPPHKRGKKIAEEGLRYRFVELAVEGEKDFYASDFELRFPNTTYTAETLERLKKEYREEQFFFILGGDSLCDFGKWYHPEKILEYAGILAFRRNGVSMREMEERAENLMSRFGGQIEILQMRDMDISSSMIREKLAMGEPVEKYLPEALHPFISELEEIYR